VKERDEKERKKEKMERQKDDDEESEEESEMEDSIIIEDSEDDDEEKFEEDDEENLEEENEEIQDPLQFLLPTVEETDWDELTPLLLQMQHTLNVFGNKHRTVRDNRFIGENIKVMKQYKDYMELDPISKLSRPLYDEYFMRLTQLIKQAADMYVDVNNRKIKTTVKAVTTRKCRSF
jgi:hypothetical protein